jgi:hypothetical protein
MPYATTLRDGKTLSAVPAYIVAERNFIVANYAADGGCLDKCVGLFLRARCFLHRPTTPLHPLNRQ